MMPSTPRFIPALLLCLLLATAAAQTAAPGVLLGDTAEIDATLIDAPTDGAGPSAVMVRGPTDEDVASLRVVYGADGTRLLGTLPDLRGGPLLARIDDEALWPCPMTVSGPARFLPVALRVADDATVIDLANRALPMEPEAGYRQLVLVFADADVYVQGACHEAPQALTVELYLRPGWNLLVSEVIDAGGGELLVVLRSAAERDFADVGWYWRPLGSGRTTETVPQRP